MKKNFQIRNDMQMVECIATIKDLPLDDVKPFQVTIVEGDKLRSLLQNKLYWKHVYEIMQETGSGKMDTHYELKREHLHAIFMAGETANNLVYQINYQALCLIKKSGVNIDFQIMHNRLLSTTDCNVSQMSLFIKSYSEDLIEKGYYLTDPTNYYKGE